jgi:hypothetical protein
MTVGEGGQQHQKAWGMPHENNEYLVNDDIN